MVPVPLSNVILIYLIQLMYTHCLSVFYNVISHNSYENNVLSVKHLIIIKECSTSNNPSLHAVVFILWIENQMVRC